MAKLPSIIEEQAKLENDIKSHNVVENENRAQIEQNEVVEALAEAYNEDYYSNYLNQQN